MNRQSRDDFYAYRYTRALVRRPGPEMTGALSRDGGAARISIDRASLEHARYVRTLTELGLDVIELEPDPAFPDGCFVEDTCVMLPGLAVITAPGAPSRSGETDSVARAIAPLMEVRRMKGGGTLDGGDVLRLGPTYLIGLSERTDLRGAEELGEIVQDAGADFRLVEVGRGLHLKSAVTPLSHGSVLGLDFILSDAAFDGLAKITVPAAEAGAANVVAANGKIIMADGFPETTERLARAGYKVIGCDISEFAKADGGLSCLSILW